MICNLADRIFPIRLTSGGVLTMGYCSLTVGCCFPYCFMEIFVGGKVMLGGSPPQGKTLVDNAFENSFCVGIRFCQFY